MSTKNPPAKVPATMPRKENNNEEDTEKDPTCISCGSFDLVEEADKKGHVMDTITEFYWKNLMDNEQVETSEYQNHEFCKECFHDIVDLYDMDRMTELMEKRLETHQKKLVQISLAGIEKLTQDNVPHGRIQKLMEKEWKDKVKNDVGGGTGSGGAGVEVQKVPKSK